MAAPMVRTSTPGIYKRGSRYVLSYRVDGKQKWESARTLADARALRDKRRVAVAEGEFHAGSNVTFAEYAAEWIDRYQGKGRGFRESTREEYRRSLERYALPFFGRLPKSRQKLSAVTPRDVSNFIAWMIDAEEQGRELSDSTVRNAFNPVRACFSTAVRENLIRSNPTRDVALPHRPKVDENDGDHEVRVFTGDELLTALRVVHPKHRTLFRLLAETGLRISEALALQWKHVQVDGAAPEVRVRRAYVRGRFNPPKSRHGRRDIPLSLALADELRIRRSSAEWCEDDDLVFPSEAGAPIDVHNLRRRFLRPAVAEAGAEWAGFHTFRHTCASMLFGRGRNPKQVQKWLGHHSAAFTMDRYVHLLGGDKGEALDVFQSVNRVQTQHPETARNDQVANFAGPACPSGFDVLDRMAA
jgi:integrase